MLAGLAYLKNVLRIFNDTSQDVLLQQYLPVADAHLKRFIKSNPETTVYAGSPAAGGTGPFAEFRDGSGVNELALWQRPVRPLVMQGTLTQGSPIITGLPSSGFMSTANMLANMPVTLHGQSARQGNNANAIPAFTVLTAAPGPAATTATMSQNAASSGTFLLVFGLSVYFNVSGAYGDGVQPGQSAPGFTTQNSQLFLGLNYELARDEPGYGGSKSGILRYVAGSGNYFGWGCCGDGPGRGWGNRGGLTSSMPPAWPRTYGGIRIDYAAGYGIGAPVGGDLPAGTTLPVELSDAVCKIVAMMRAITVVGAPVTADAAADQVMKMMAADTGSNPEIGTIRALARSYRDVVC